MKKKKSIQRCRFKALRQARKQSDWSLIEAYVSFMKKFKVHYFRHKTSLLELITFIRLGNFLMHLFALFLLLLLLLLLGFIAT